MLQWWFLCKRQSSCKVGNCYGAEVFCGILISFGYVESGTFFMRFDVMQQYYNETGTCVHKDKVCAKNPWLIICVRKINEGQKLKMGPAVQVHTKICAQ